MLQSANSTPPVINAVDVSGKVANDAGELNEHVWYDLPSVAKVADRIAGVLGEKDAADAPAFRANARTFVAKLHALQQREVALRARYAGAGVAITEPVPLYLLTACGLVNRTPEAFSSAVEDEQDVAVRVLRQTERLFSAHRVKALVYNAQTTGAQTGQVIDAARAAGVPVVPVTETLPAGLDYLGWMAKNLSAVSTALGGSS
jgi:zinc/manganese transport system substrate-binding protein